MSRHGHYVRRVNASEVLGLPKILWLYSMRKSQLLKVHVGRYRGRVPVEDADSLRSIGQWAYPHLNGSLRAYPVTLFPCSILIDSDDITICQKCNRFGSHRRQVVSSKQRCGENGPQAHVGSILIRRHPTVSYLEHVRIIPVSGASKAGQSGLAEPDLCHPGVLVGDVPCRAPEVATNARPPLPDCIISILAKTVHDGSASAA